MTISNPMGKDPLSMSVSRTFLDSFQGRVYKPSNLDALQTKLCEDKGFSREMQEHCESWGAPCTEEVGALCPEQSGIILF